VGRIVTLEIVGSPMMKGTKDCVDTFHSVLNGNGGPV
jgi:hypothetical protein